MPRSLTQESGIAVVVLAAGGAARMGSPKQLLPYQGKPLVRHAAEVALGVGPGPVIVVLGAEADRVAAALCGLPVYEVRNDGWRGGMGTSISAGVEAAELTRSSAVLLMLADQPLVTSSHLRRIVQAHRGNEVPIVASRYAGTVGVPALFAREIFGELRRLKPDQGCKSVIRAIPGRATYLDLPEAEQDVDTPADYERLRSRLD